MSKFISALLGSTFLGSVFTNTPIPVAGFSPLDLSPALWFDASDTSTITETGGAVSQWDDKSGNDYHATQGTGSKQPATGTRTVNGLNVLDFDGANDFLDMSASLHSVPSGPNTVIIVALTDLGLSTPQRLLNGDDGSGTRWAVGIRNGTSGIYAVNNISFNALNTNSPSDNGAHIFGSRRDGTSLEAVFDGDVTADTNAKDVTVSELVLGRYGASSIEHLDGIIAEVLIFDKALTDEEMNQVGNYLSTKWGATWTDIVFSPLDLSPALWFDASDTSTITEAGGAVSQWDDKSGNDHHVSQGTGSNQPTYDPVGMEMQYGSGDSMNVGVNLGVTDVTVFVVGSHTSNVNWGNYAVSYGGDGAGFGVRWNGGGASQQIGFKSGGNNGTFSSTHALDTDYIVSGYVDATSGIKKGHVDGVEGLSTSSGTTITNQSNLSVGASSSGHTIKEVIIYPSVLTDEEMDKVGNYLSTKWGTAWTNIVFSPLVLSPALWLDASDTSTITEAGGAVSQLDDKSGNANHVTQGSGSSQPTTGARTENGLNVLDFDGGDYLSLPSAMFAVPQGDNTIIFLAKSDNGGGGSIYLLQSDVGWKMSLNPGSNRTQHRNHVSTTVNNTVADYTNYHYFMQKRSGSALTGYQDNASTTYTPGAGNVTPTSANIGETWNGTIAEAMIFDKLLTDEEINQVGNYLSTKWGTSWTDI